MLKRFAFLIAGVIAVASLIGCNSKSSNFDAEFTYSSTQVKAFRLAPNKKVLASLDTVFFSIDLVNARIFNADSLPYGTDIRKLVVNLSTDGCSVIEFNVPLKNGGDTIINYITNSTDSLNFANGPVTLHLVSYDGRAERNYQIKVNVHQVVPDSLCWDELAMRQLPTNIADIVAQKTVRQDDKAVCLTTDGSDFCAAMTSDPSSDEWEYHVADITFNAQVNSLAATDEALFILDADGALYTSADLGRTWTSTGETWRSIVGAYGSRLLGLKDNAGSLAHVTYPASGERAADKDFPVEGYSNAVSISSVWSINPQLYILGGKTSAGERTKAVWGYDGKNWAKISKAFPTEIEGGALISYKVAKTDTATWTVKEMPALLVIGGETPTGLNAKTYISRDQGITWKVADELLTLPSYIDPRRDAQPLIYDVTYPLSRAIAPPAHWECPYIYWFGGTDSRGNLYDSVWRGVINRLMFMPLE